MPARGDDSVPMALHNPCDYTAGQREEAIAAALDSGEAHRMVGQVEQTVRAALAKAGWVALGAPFTVEKSTTHLRSHVWLEQAVQDPASGSTVMLLVRLSAGWGDSNFGISELALSVCQQLQPDILVPATLAHVSVMRCPQLLAFGEEFSLMEAYLEHLARGAALLPELSAAAAESLVGNLDVLLAQ